MTPALLQELAWLFHVEACHARSLAEADRLLAISDTLDARALRAARGRK